MNYVTKQKALLADTLPGALLEIDSTTAAAAGAAGGGGGNGVSASSSGRGVGKQVEFDGEQLTGFVEKLSEFDTQMNQVVVEAGVLAGKWGGPGGGGAHERGKQGRERRVSVGRSGGVLREKKKGKGRRGREGRVLRGTRGGFRGDSLGVVDGQDGLKEARGGEGEGRGVLRGKRRGRGAEGEGGGVLRGKKGASQGGGAFLMGERDSERQEEGKGREVIH